ncbi:MAG TPA: pilus assembly protein TadG-related protein [Pyrinomonadaceae bacterium]|jgi:Flp pilus assembly protein TadG
MQLKHHSRASRRKGERGNVLAYTVLSALFLFLAVGLGVDLSHFYLAKTEMQNAADAAALAGASALTLPNPGRITTAVDRAIQLLNTNKYNFDNKSFGVTRENLCQPGEACVTFAINLNDPTYVNEATALGAPENIRFIKVTTPSKPVSVFFASPILGSALSLAAKATAGLSIPGNARFCIAPLSAVQCDGVSPACTLTDSRNTNPNDLWGKCPGSDPYAIQTFKVKNADGTETTKTCDPKKQFCSKCVYTVRSAPSGGPSPGNFNILGCAGNGANDVRNALAAYGVGCQCGSVSPGDSVETKTGVDAGPIRDGLNVRFDDYSGPLKYSKDIPPDTNVAQRKSGNGNKATYDGITYDEYTHPGDGPPTKIAPTSGAGADGRRVLVIPIVPVTEFGNGHSTVKITSLGAFFMQRQVTGTGNGADIRVEYIGDNINGIVGLNPGGTSTTNVVTPVLYR